MSSSVFKDSEPINSSQQEDTLVILVNQDGTISVGPNTLHTLLSKATKSSTASLSVVRVNPPSPLPEDADNIDEDGDCDLTKEKNIPRVNLTVTKYFTPEETQLIAADIMNFGTETPAVDQPLSAEEAEFQLYVIRNDHCYTTFTSPSQKHLIRPSSPSGYPDPEDLEKEDVEAAQIENELEQELTRLETQKNKVIKPRKTSISTSTNNKSRELKSSTKGNASVVNSASESGSAVPVVSRHTTKESEKSVNQIDQSTSDLQSVLEDENEYDSEHMPTSDSESPDHDSDADFKLDERRSSRSKKSTRNNQRHVLRVKHNSIKKKIRKKQILSTSDMEMESMLQEMEGPSLIKAVRRRSSSKIEKYSKRPLKGKSIKGNKTLKTLNIDKTINTVESVTKVITKPEPKPPSPEPVKVEEVKPSPKAPPKKDKKPPAHVTEALFSDMTSLFSTPDIIKKVPSSSNKISDQRKSIDKLSDSSISPVKKSPHMLDERRKSSKDSSTSDNYSAISQTNIANSVVENDSAKQLELFDSIVKGGFPGVDSTTIAVAGLDNLPNLASILNNTNGPESAIDDATLLSNVGVNLLDTKLPNVLDAVSINTLTNDIPDPGPLSAVSTGSLDLEDNALLENLHNEEGLSEDFLMHVAQQLAENSDLQEVLDKQVLGNQSLLNATTAPAPIPIITPVRAPKPKPLESPFVKLAQQKLASKEAAMANLNRKEPIQIVRSDGRVITLPPIEAPATRSKRRNMAATTTTSASVPSKVMSKVDHQNAVKKQPPAVELKKLIPDALRRRSRHSSEQSITKAPENTAADDEESDDDSWKSEDDPDRLWCICKQPHNNRFMICCDTCEDWFHGKCVNVTKALGKQMEDAGVEWTCPNCKGQKTKTPFPKKETKGSPPRNLVDKIIEEAVEDETFIPLPPAPGEKLGVSSGTSCIVCKQEARNSSIYCSDLCIIKHATDSRGPPTIPPSQSKVTTPKSPAPPMKPKNDRVIVFERATGRCLAGPSAPTASNLKQWLQENPTFEVVRPGTHPAVTIKKPVAQINKVTTQQKVAGSVGPQPNNKNIKTTNLKTVPKQIILVQPPKILSHGAKATTPTQVKQIPAITKAVPQKSGNQKAATSSSSQPNKTPQTPPAKLQTPKSKNPAPEPIRLNVRKTLKEQLQLRVSESVDLKLSPEEVGNFSKETEFELFNLFKDIGAKYKAKYRSLLFNIKDKKNLTLFKKICDGSITPKQLVRLSPDELASQELAQWREKEAKHQLEMIKKSELDLLSCAKTYVLKTHKGEEVIENRISDMGGVDPNVSVEDVVTALNNSAVSSTSEVLSSSHTAAETKDKKHKTKRDRSRSKDRKDRSRSRDRDYRNKGRSEKKSSHRNKSRSHRSKSKEKERERGRERDSDRHSKRRDKDKKETRDRSRSRDKHGSKDSESKRDSSRRNERSKSETKSKNRDNKDNTKDRDSKINKDLFKDKESTSSQASENKSVESLEYKEEKHIEELPMQESPEQTVPESSHTSLIAAEAKEIADLKPDSELDQEPTSTVTIGTPEFGNQPDESLNLVEEKEALVWTGVINMIDVAQFSISAIELAGDASELSRDLPPKIDIVGRISPNTVWDYISKMKNSCTKDIVVIKLIAANEEENVPYVALFSYLHTRQRLGVIKNNSAAIKDFYIFPLNSKDKVPDILLPFNKSFDEAAPHTLLGIIVRSRRKRTALSATLSSGLPIPPKLSRRATTPPRSYTPPVIINDVGYTPPSSPRHFKKDRLKSSHLISTKEKIAPPTLAPEDLEPYSPGGSDSGEENVKSTLGCNIMPPITKTELEQEMDELNRKIEERRKQIQNISGLINANSMDSQVKDDEPYSPSRPVSPAPTSIPLADISIPSNLQEILASIQRTTTPAAPPKNPYLIPDPVDPTGEEYTPISYSSKKIENYVPGSSKLALNANLGISTDIIPGVNDDSNINFIEKNYLSENVSETKRTFYTKDIDERLAYSTTRDIDERVNFPVGSKDVDERIIPLANINKTELPMPPSMSPPLLPPPPPNISNIRSGEIKKSYNTTSKLAQLSEEELLSMVPDEVLSPLKSVSDKTPHSKEKRNIRDLPVPPSPPVITQGPVMYTQIGKRPLKDTPISGMPQLPDLSSPPPVIPSLGVSSLKKMKLEQPPPPGMEDFID